MFTFVAEAKCGFKTTEWEVKIGKNLHVAPIVENGELENVDDVRACMLHCMELDECVSFVHSASQRKCIFNDKKEQADEEVSDLEGVDYYELRSCSSGMSEYLIILEETVRFHNMFIIYNIIYTIC